ncbi:hypothetical protein GDO78_018633 [Eleutherodactylus coqui]|uniref:VHS domain-containing protein n=1 Tax=Eleutherodactylus coqui TaxID=57060 RepID=A0A8J6JZZ1_ELECQ|nr:hypothetical protein GDO78_018633 [Eleutherodactylus coqui]
MAEKATDGSLQSEDWTLNMEICDIINETEEGPKDAIRALKKRLNGNKNYREVMLALTVLETCVKNCGHRFHVLVTHRDFIDGVLVKIISPKNNPPTIVQDKVLALIQAWADAFRSSPDLTGVVHIYEELKRKGIEFPMADLDALSPIHTPQRVSLPHRGLAQQGDVSSNSVSSMLSTLPNTNPRDDFDMFAQTRSSSLADQRKDVTYEDPQALGGLATALDVRQQNTGGIPVAQASDMDDLEEWLGTDVKGEELEEGVTSEEFDKFLEERAKAVERLPDLPSPPSTEPSLTVNPANRKKQERADDTLFAL